MITLCANSQRVRPAASEAFPSLEATSLGPSLPQRCWTIQAAEQALGHLKHGRLAIPTRQTAKGGPLPVRPPFYSDATFANTYGRFAVEPGLEPRRLEGPAWLGFHDKLKPIRRIEVLPKNGQSFLRQSGGLRVA
jgi:hypothetical protein